MKTDGKESSLLVTETLRRSKAHLPEARVANLNIEVGSFAKLPLDRSQPRESSRRWSIKINDWETNLQKRVGMFVAHDGNAVEKISDGQSAAGKNGGGI